MRSQSYRSSRLACRLEFAGMPEIALSVPLWCRSRATAWQTLIRTRLTKSRKHRAG